MMVTHYMAPWKVVTFKLPELNGSMVKSFTNASRKKAKIRRVS